VTSHPPDYPRVAVTAKQSDGPWIAEKVQPYLDAVAAAGGEPLVVAPDTELLTDHQLIDHIHALLLSGGGDIHPRRYGCPLDGTEIDSIDEKRDEMELELTQAALSRDLPILAICRGIQVLNVAMGGGLVQHIEGHRNPPPDRSMQHTVRVDPDSHLAQIMGCDGTLHVNSSHHQAIGHSSLAAGLSVSAHSLLGDEVIEAVESPAHSWVVGVQWHPERDAEVPPAHGRLFRDVVIAATTRRQHHCDC
jgi:gamma-glutamyl-gamma-aminobutyrate hydrolase PuuD